MGGPAPCSARRRCCDSCPAATAAPPWSSWASPPARPRRSPPPERPAPSRWSRPRPDDAGTLRYCAGRAAHPERPSNPVIRALVLGIVQGLTEFLPISSSAHLSIVPRLLGYPTPTLAFEVLLHFGTLAAVVAYFARDLWAFVLCLFAPGRGGRTDLPPPTGLGLAGGHHRDPDRRRTLRADPHPAPGTGHHPRRPRARSAVRDRPPTDCSSRREVGGPGRPRPPNRGGGAEAAARGQGGRHRAGAGAGTGPRHQPVRDHHLGRPVPGRLARGGGPLLVPAVDPGDPRRRHPQAGRAVGRHRDARRAGGGHPGRRDLGLRGGVVPAPPAADAHAVAVHLVPPDRRRPVRAAAGDRPLLKAWLELDSDTVSGRRPGGVMFSIGDFASHGRVSVRMLRHYDAIGLLRPAQVDQVTGYRSAGYNRELYIECGADRDAWVTELQEPVATS